MNKLIIIIVTYFIATVAVFTFRPFGENNALLEQAMLLTFSLTASMSALSALLVYGKGPRLRSLLSLAVGLLCFSIADFIFIYYDFILHNLPYPSPADYFYLAAYSLVFIGLMIEIAISDVDWKKMSKKVYLVAGTFTAVAISAFAYISIFLSYSPDEPLGVNLVTIGYSVGDILLVIAGFFLLLVVWEYKGGKASKVWINLFLGFLLTMIADYIYATNTEGFAQHTGFIYEISQYAYILGYMFMAFGFLYLRNILVEFQKASLKLKKSH